MLKPRFVIFLLAFALLIQNTCPHGFAGKTSVAATCSHCPMKQHQSVSPDGQKRIISASSTVHFPMFVFSVPKTVHTFQLEPVKIAQPPLANSYEDALPAGLLRPPQA